MTASPARTGGNSDWRPEGVRSGDALIATDALGQDHLATAVSGYEGTHEGRRKQHDFPVIFIRIAGSWDRVPWPVESLRPADGAR